MVLSDNGDIYTWGGSLRGKRGKGASVRFTGAKYEPQMVESLVKNNIKVKQIECGEFHSMALSYDGYLYTWGAQEFG